MDRRTSGGQLVRPLDRSEVERRPLVVLTEGLPPVGLPGRIACFTAGVGHALHAACLRAWRVAGHTAATLDVLWHNRRARTFYTARGWHPDPSRGPAPDATHLTLTLRLGGGL